MNVIYSELKEKVKFLQYNSSLYITNTVVFDKNSNHYAIIYLYAEDDIADYKDIKVMIGTVEYSTILFEKNDNCLKFLVALGENQIVDQRVFVSEYNYKDEIHKPDLYLIPILEEYFDSKVAKYLITNSVINNLPYESGEYWVCECGCVNKSESCSKCQKEKEELLKKDYEETIIDDCVKKFKHNFKASLDLKSQIPDLRKDLGRNGINDSKIEAVIEKVNDDAVLNKAIRDKKASNKKISIRFLVGAIIIVILSISLYFINYSKIQLSKVEKAVSNGLYEEAMVIIDKNTKKKEFTNYVYEIIDYHIENGNYDDAFNVLNKYYSLNVISTEKNDMLLCEITTGYISKRGSLKYEFIDSFKSKDKDQNIMNILSYVVNNNIQWDSSFNDLLDRINSKKENDETIGNILEYLNQNNDFENAIKIAEIWKGINASYLSNEKSIIYKKAIEYKNENKLSSAKKLLELIPNYEDCNQILNNTIFKIVGHRFVEKSDYWWHDFEIKSNVFEYQSKQYVITKVDGNTLYCSSYSYVYDYSFAFDYFEEIASNNQVQYKVFVTVKNIQKNEIDESGWYVADLD